jgi:hypothetical protein
MWIHEDLYEPYDEGLPEKQKRERQFERKVARLAKLLCYRRAGEPEKVDWEALREARLMLSARELLEACQYSLTLLGQLSSEQFSAGGDRPAREKLLKAIENANSGSGTFNSLVLMERCAEDVRRAILVNRSSVFEPILM